jgi:hypothetical protein
MDRIRKYPRTHHIQGSRLQPGDEDLTAVPFADLAGRHLVVEEKIDGANAGVCFVRGTLHLQSRGHFLTGGERERHFALLKSWARCHEARLREALGERYVMYGEWVYAKHTIFYDALPHYFLEFDVLDRESDAFLDTPSRQRLLAGVPVASVPVLADGRFESLAALRGLVGPSRYKTPRWREHLQEAADEGESGRFGSVERALAQTDPSDEAEGLYVKVEEGGHVALRLKWVRPSFLTAVLDGDSHWLDRPIVQNRLASGVDVFAPALPRRS